MGVLCWQDLDLVREVCIRRPLRLVTAAGFGAALLTLPVYAPSAAAFMAASFFLPVEPRPKPVSKAYDLAPSTELRPRGVKWALQTPANANDPQTDDFLPLLHISTDGSDPVFRRDMASLEELGLVDGAVTAELPVLAAFGNRDAWLKPFVGGSLALTQSYADTGHNRLIVITDPDAVIRFQGTAGLSLLSNGPSELQVFYRYIKFTDPSLRPSASLLALTDTLTSRQRQHEVMMGWRLKF